MRGIGKTTLAAAFAEAHGADYRATWWIRAQTKLTTRADLVALGVRLDWVSADYKEAPALATVMERLRYEGEGVLLIYDNAIDARSLKDFLPRGGGARVLITSNDQAWRSIAAEPVEIRLWPKEIGSDYLVVRTGRDSERGAAEALSVALGGLPLAHEQAAAYCEQLGIPLAEYGRRFAAAPMGLLDDDDTAPVEYHDGLTVAKTFALAIAEAAKLHPAAEPLILHVSLLAPEPIPLFLFAEGRRALSEPLASLLCGDGLEKAVAKLRMFGLIEYELIADEYTPTTTTTVRLHPLVREVASKHIPSGDQQTMFNSLISVLSILLSQTSIHNDSKAWVRMRRLERLTTLLLGAAKPVPYGLEYQIATSLNLLASYYLEARSDTTEAESFFCQSYEQFRKPGVGSNSDIALILNNIGICLYRKGQLDDALVKFEEAGSFAEQHKSKNFAVESVGRSINIARVFADQKEYNRSLKILKSAAEVIVLIEEGESKDIYLVKLLNNIGRVLLECNKYKESEIYLRRALEICQTSNWISATSYDTAVTLNNLVCVLIDLGSLGEADNKCLEAISICEENFGTDHPSTNRMKYNLTRVYIKRGQVDQAKVIARSALLSLERKLGGDHAWTQDMSKICRDIENRAHSIQI